MSLFVRAACKRRMKELGIYAFRDSKFEAQLTSFSDDPDQCLYFGAATGEKDPESLDLTMGTDRFTIPFQFESHGHTGGDDDGAAAAEASVEEAFNLFVQVLMETAGMDHPDVLSELDDNDIPVYRPAQKPHVTKVEGPGHWRAESGSAIGWLAGDLQFFSNVRTP